MISWGISGYHRPDCKTYKTLVGIGISPDDIVICVNDEDDFEEYSRIYPKVIYTKGDCVAQNRNKLLRTLSGDVVLLDDDIRKFQKLDRANNRLGVSWRTIDSADELIEVVEDSFKAARACSAALFGTYSIVNAGWALDSLMRDGLYSLNKLFQGGFCGFVKNVGYNENYKVLDDYELILRLIQRGGLSIRRNDLIAIKNGMGNDKGGYYDLYRIGIQQKYGRMLADQYKDLITANKDYTRFKLRR